MDNEEELELPPTKRLRLDEAKLDVPIDSLSKANGTDDLRHPPPSHIENSKMSPNGLDQPQEGDFPPEIPEIPEISSSDNNPQLPDGTWQSYEHGQDIAENVAIFATLAQETDVGEVQSKDMLEPQEAQATPTKEESSSTTEQSVSDHDMTDGHLFTAQPQMDEAMLPVDAAETQELAKTSVRDDLQEVANVITNVPMEPELSDVGLVAGGNHCSVDTHRIVIAETERKALQEDGINLDAQVGSGGGLKEEQEPDHPSGEATSIIQSSKQHAEISNSSAEAEFERDSSPYDSSASSEESSSDSSSSESEVDDYEMLGPQEEARRLMAEDGEAEEKATSGVPRTINEKPDEVIPIPDVTITPEMKLEDLGSVENLVENVALIKANTSGEYQVLEAGSVLCLEDRKVIGVVAETLGRVQQPYYSVCFTNAAAMSVAGIVKDVKVYYVSKYATTVFTQPLKAFKGSDASNMHDEEVGDEELEFSDDEAEAEHRRQAKLQKRARIDNKRGRGDGFSRGPQQRSGQSSHHGSNRSPPGPKHSIDPVETSLNYDDAAEDGDGLYIPLSRPPNLHEMMPPQDRPREHSAHRGNAQRGSFGRGRGDRGNNRGRHRGNRGGGPGGAVDRGSQSAGSYPHSREPPRQQPSQQPQDNSFDPSGGNFARQPSHYNGSTNLHNYPQNSSTISQSHTHPSPSFPYQPSYEQSYPQQYQQPNPPQNSYQSHYPQQQQQQQPSYTPAPQYPLPQTPTATPSPAVIPPGAHINPNFFGQQAQHSPQSWPQQAYYQPQQYQEYQQPSSAYGRSGPLSPDAARRLQDSLDRLTGVNGGAGGRG